jgi:hypothetical protein
LIEAVIRRPPYVVCQTQPWATAKVPNETRNFGEWLLSSGACDTADP